MSNACAECAVMCAEVLAKDLYGVCREPSVKKVKACQWAEVETGEGNTMSNACGECAVMCAEVLAEVLDRRSTGGGSENSRLCCVSRSVAKSVHVGAALSSATQQHRGSRCRARNGGLYNGVYTGARCSQRGPLYRPMARRRTATLILRFIVILDSSQVKACCTPGRVRILHSALRVTCACCRAAVAVYLSRV